MPSSSSRFDPGLSAAKISGCGRYARVASPGLSVRSSRNAEPAASVTGPVGERADAKLRPLQVGQHADRATDLALDVADLLQPFAVLLVRAVAEIQAKHVDAGEEQRADHVLGRAGRAQRGDDLCVAMSAHVK